MKSVYIITMHCPLNYGAILQTYALQTYLEYLSLSAKVINYRPEYIVCDQSLMYVGGEKYKQNLFTRWAYRFISAPSKICRRKRFARFAKNELHLSPIYKTYEEIKNAELNADYFFCGSDQIWNVVSDSHKDPAYFLEFVTDYKKRKSYAASGNLPLIDEVKRVTFPMINKIDQISMREDSTILNIQSFINKPIVHVCDPVFLLDADDWRALYMKHSSVQLKEKYILAYPMGNGAENTISTAREVADQMKLPLYMISASKKKDSRIDRRYNTDPYSFLYLIDHAECVVTNSFHGTSFSIILNKQFWTCVAEGSNQRITSLLTKAGISDRLLVGEKRVEINNQVDLISARKKLHNFIINSKDYIKSCIYE